MEWQRLRLYDVSVDNMGPTDTRSDLQLKRSRRRISLRWRPGRAVPYGRERKFRSGKFAVSKQAHGNSEMMYLPDVPLGQKGREVFLHQAAYCKRVHGQIGIDMESLGQVRISITLTIVLKKRVSVRNKKHGRNSQLRETLGSTAHKHQRSTWYSTLEQTFQLTVRSDHYVHNSGSIRVLRYTVVTTGRATTIWTISVNGLINENSTTELSVHSNSGWPDKFRCLHDGSTRRRGTLVWEMFVKFRSSTKMVTCSG